MAEAKRICSIPGCGKPHRARGWCSMHYCRWRNEGEPGDAAPRVFTHTESWSTMERLQAVGWDEVKNGCWEWRGGVTQKGYGRIALNGRSSVRVHRLMWEMHNGPIPDGLVVRHRCDNPPCINPDHLELGTVAENQRDMVERGRSLAYATGRYDGVCINGKHDVTQPGALKQVAKKGRGTYWTCVGCDQDRKRKHEAKKAARKAAERKAA